MYVVDRTFRFIARAMLAAFIIAAVGISAASAQQSQTPTVSAFLANPEQLLQQHPDGGMLLANAVQQLALSDPATFKVLLGLLANANERQKGAIGEGLAQATKSEVLTNQELATEWQQQIAAVTDPSFKLAATNAFGDVQIGAVGGGPLGAAGGGQGGISQGSSSSGPPQNLQPAVVSTPLYTFTSSVSAGSSPSSSPSRSVSP